MASRIPKKTAGEELGLKLLQSVREMKAGQAARVTKPSGAAQTLIRIAKRHPEVVREALG